MKSHVRFGLAVLALSMFGAVGAGAQSYDDGYDAPPRSRAYRYQDERYEPRRPIRREAGLNCDAVQPGLLGAHPFSCPLPGPRPLGARCFCQTPVAPLSGGDTVAGRVVP